MAKTLYPQIAMLLLAIAAIALLIIGVGASPVEVLNRMIGGAFSNANQFARVLATLAPVILCTSGLLFTFTAGLYNLGIEGQIMFGAIATMVPLQLLGPVLPSPLVIAIAVLCGGLGGMFWGLLAGWLNVYGRVNEIFAGLGLNFAADGLALYLILAPGSDQV